MKLKVVVVDLEMSRRQKRIGAGGLALAVHVQRRDRLRCATVLASARICIRCHHRGYIDGDSYRGVPEWSSRHTGRCRRTWPSRREWDLRRSAAVSIETGSH